MYDVADNPLLFNPGPTNVHPSVREAMLCADMNHRDEDFKDLLAGLRGDLVALAGGAAIHTCVPLVCSGTGGCEAVLGSVAGKVLILEAGRYGQRLALIAKTLGVDHEVLSFVPLQGIDVDRVETALKADRSISHLCFAHHETTSSLLAPLAPLCELARRLDVVTVVDAISSLFGHDIELERDQVDFCVLSANKCLESTPGVSFVLAQTDRLEALQGTARSFYFDLHKQWRRLEENGAPRFTAAIPTFFAAQAAVRRLQNEGVPARAERYRTLRQRLREGVADAGFAPVALDEDKTANILQLVYLPRGGFDYAYFYAEMRRRGYIVYSDANTIASGHMFFATMGALSADDVEGFVETVRSVMTS